MALEMKPVYTIPAESKELDLIAYLRDYLKCNWVLKENSLTLGNCVVHRSFINEVSKYRNVEFIYSVKKDETRLLFNANGINDVSDIIAFSGSPIKDIEVKCTIDESKSTSFYKFYNQTIAKRNGY